MTVSRWVAPAGQPWSPVIIGDDTPWVDQYRGLFGLDTFDRFAGERAPAGPKYGRNGTVRQTWNDPLGWAGLSKVAPPFRAPEALRDRLAELEAELKTLRAENEANSSTLDGLELQVRALASDQAFAGLHKTQAAELARREAEINAGRTREAQLPGHGAGESARSLPESKPATSAIRGHT